MYQEFPHNPIQRENDGEIICSRCGLVNPGDGDSCVSVPVSTQPADESPKAA